MSLDKVVGVDAIGGDSIEGRTVAQRAVQATIEITQKYPGFTFFLYGKPEELSKALPKGLQNIRIEDASFNPENPDAEISPKYGAIKRLAIDLKNGVIAGVYTSGETEKVIPVIRKEVGMLEEFGKVFYGERIPPLIVELPKYPEAELTESWFLLDAGSIPELTRINQYLVYAHIARIFAREVKGREMPTVGLLNIGRESNKGTTLLRDVYSVLNKEPGLYFVGNVEPFIAMNDHEKGGTEDIPVDIVVCDGYAGNILIKALSTGANLPREQLKYEIKHGSWLEKLGAFFLRNAFKRVKNISDPNTYNGALFIGLNKPVVKGHGTANERGFKEGIEKVIKCIENNVTTQIQNAFASHANV